MKLSHLGLVFFVLLPRAHADAVKPPTRSPQYKRLEFESKEGVKLSYWLMTPAKVDRQKKYPLVLALHGHGGNTEAATVLASAEMREKYPCFVIAPAVSRAAVWSVPKDLRKLKGKQLLPVALELLEIIKKQYPLDPDRVYVTGQSMGGFGTFGAIATSPETFAAAIPVRGGWDPADAENMKSVKIWVFHGGSDRTVPVERSRNMVEAIKQAGGSPKYTEYPDVRHNSWSKTYASPSTWAGCSPNDERIEAVVGDQKGDSTWISDFSGCCCQPLLLSSPGFATSTRWVPRRWAQSEVCRKRLTSTRRSMRSESTPTSTVRKML